MPAVNSWTGLSLSSSKNHKSANIQRTDFYLVHFQSLGSLLLRKKKKDLWCTDKAFRIICLERHSDFAGVINFSLRRKKPGVCEKSWVWTQSIRLQKQKLPPKQWTKLFYFIKNLNTRHNKAWYFFQILKFVFLSKVMQA